MILTDRLTSLWDEMNFLQSVTHILNSKGFRFIVKNLCESLKAAARMKLRKQVASTLSRLLSCEIALSGRYWLYYESLDQLRVTLTVFKDIKVSFRLNCLKATRPRDPTITELKNASFTILYLDELVRELTFMVEEYKVLERSGYLLTAEAVLKLR